ncbi:MAG TPA: 4-alpha-glucanotransferase [Planctomycetaceae bacterium]|nr:4-alpha-glucanotransferase [Planctomycetaceae bacterium]
MPMDEAPETATYAPFAPTYRAAGILLHVTALPTPYGIGDVGPSACAWIDRLVEAGQSWWQVLPLGPTGERHSPYEPLSSFAGNTLLLSPDWLVEEGFLHRDDCAGPEFPADHVDYERVIPFKQRLVNRCWERFRQGIRTDLRASFEDFCHSHSKWLDDFSLFVALKGRHHGLPYPQWPTPLARHEPAGLQEARGELAEPAEIIRFGQFLAARHWGRLRDYARNRGVRLMGDLPIFVSLDSCDAWAHRELFQLDENCRPRALSGVPPDYFSPHGQLWGNPPYDWSALERSGYRWWIDRLQSQLEWLDLVRLDHFRAFEAAWHIPAAAATAKEGEWRPGPGAPFFVALQHELGGLPFVAEDLGMITDPVRALRDRFHLPGMRVLQFAFEGDATNPFLPHNYVPNAVVYTGTHDNDTTRGWYESLEPVQRQKVDDYLAAPNDRPREIAWEFIRLAFLSVASLAIVPLQDLHNLDSSARFNRPGEPDGNWRWRATGELLPQPIAERLRRLTEISNRRPSHNAEFLHAR